MSEYIYELKADAIPGTDWVKVSKEEWIKAERSAGFRPKLPSTSPDFMTTCATGGWSSTTGISGRVRSPSTN